MTKIIGLTGGIGSGKTMIANYMKSLGIPVYIADDEAKNLMETREVIDAIVNEFGDEIFVNNSLNREKLAKIVFTDPNKLQKLNAIIHPAVKKHFETWLHHHSTYPFVIKEAAILFESGSYRDCDAVITVTAPLETRIQRVIARDKTSRENVLQRMQNQWTDEQRIDQSDYVIHNISVKETQKQTDKILKLL
ncbi:dephospho-CoA kinase [Flavobacterium silvisoli]|uniref:Dephospho-CoA kinase n=1 Tax=Flavobacterium silvisoli TaxID=2529433 RepID=A0A4Q9YT49_9FLAO|nr:dephospho-CoA kinase [Flavobacterium silvisoli]TBX66599.1 dephospho-CoA kinase [Flavobacterium silvisoli]